MADRLHAIIKSVVILSALLGYVSQTTAGTKHSVATPADGRVLPADQLSRLAQAICQSAEVTPALLQTFIDEDFTIDKELIRFRQTEIGLTITVSSTGNNQPLLKIQLLQPPGRPAQTNVTSYIANSLDEPLSVEKPDTRLALGGDCEIRAAHQLVYDESTQTQLYVTALDANLQPAGDRQWLNPQLPELTATATDAIKVALVDSGVNYLLPEIASGLATDAQGNPSGYDFWEMDNQPFDANPSRSPFFVQRHGTRTASILLTEAPGIKLVPYRYPRNDMSRMTDLIGHADNLGIKLVGMPLGSNTYADWADFETAARRHPHILFIASAGNNGRDIDQTAVYPAAMDLPNMLVVTSADDFVHPAERTNFGRLSVDYLVPAEQIRATDFNGDNIRVSGSSYAVSRVLALAARLLQQDPNQSVTDLMAAIRKLSVKAETSRFVSIGYLGDPLTSNDLSDLQLAINDAKPFKTAVQQTTAYSMPLQLIRLDSLWDNAELKVEIEKANRVYEQCKIGLVVESVLSLTGPDYLKDLSSGNALTLSRAMNRSFPVNQSLAKNSNASGKSSLTRIFLARDTIMLEQYDANAFGIGNSRNRPWMTNSLWITYGLEDTDIALAHELFHIASNSGRHSTLAGNLMQDRTLPGNTTLTEDQCADAIKNGLANGVLHKL